MVLFPRVCNGELLQFTCAHVNMSCNLQGKRLITVTFASIHVHVYMYMYIYLVCFLSYKNFNNYAPREFECTCSMDSLWLSHLHVHVYYTCMCFLSFFTMYQSTIHSSSFHWPTSQEEWVSLVSQQLDAHEAERQQWTKTLQQLMSSLKQVSASS